VITPEEINLMCIAHQTNQALSRTADHIIESTKILTAEDNKELFIYHEGYYQKNSNAIIEPIIKNLWQDKLKRNYINEIIQAHIIPQTYIPREQLNNNIEYTNLKNGVLNLTTGLLEPHNPNYNFTFQLPVNYKPEATCPKIETFLKQVCKEETDIETIYELISYCLYRSYPLAKVFVLLGGGRNGKSTLIEVIKAFLGADNIRNMSMHQLEHDTYSKGYLFGKHANMNPDVGNKKLITSGAIKSLTGGDMIDSNVKHKDYMRFKNFAKLIFASNELPSSDDTSYAWMSRWIFLKFPHNFDGEKCQECHQIHPMDKNLLSKLTTEEELSGLLNKVIPALLRLKNNGWNFTLSSYVKNMEKEYARLSDPVKAFIEDFIEEDEYEKVSKTDVYNAYSNYVYDLGDKPIMSNAFTQKLKQYIPSLKDTRTGNTKYWLGLKLREKHLQSDLNNVDNPGGGLSPSAWKEQE